MALLNRRVTILMIGTDTSAARQASGYGSVNTDSLIVVSLDAKHRRIDMVSVPRDTVDIPTPLGLWTSKINGIQAARGIPAVKQAVADLLAIHIDYYIEIDMDDLVRLVDAVGGVDVNVPYAIYDSDSDVRLAISAGPHHLNGRLALAYVRSRHQDGDFARAGHQQVVLYALARKLGALKPSHVLDVLRALSALQTDLPLRDIPTVAALIHQTASAPVVHTVLQPPAFALFAGMDGTRGWVIEPNVRAMRAFMASLLSLP